MEKRLPLPTGTVLQGRYRIMRQLGHGGFGAVYEAIDDEIGKSFALKETFYAANEELRQAFKREARMLASLEHDAFPNVSHYFTEGEGCFLVMELIRGDDLDKLLSQRAAPFEQEQVLTWAEQILDALQDLHTGGIVHRDIKPSNLKLTPKGRIKLLDFGIAKGALEGETTAVTTVGSLAAATLQYAPLEQVLKASVQYQMMLSVISADKVIEILKHGTTAASDLYALAATLYQMLTKQLPADAATRALAIWSGQPDRLIPAHEVNPQVSKEVSAVLQKAMGLDRTERYQSAAEMQQILRAATTPVTEPTQPALTEPLRTVNNVAGQITQPNPRPFIAEPLKTIPATIEVPLLPKQPPAKERTNSKWIYAGAGGLCLLLLIGLIAYFSATKNSQPPNKPVVDTKYELAQTLTGHSSTAMSVAFSPDGKTLASGSADSTIKLWDAVSGKLKQTLAGHSRSVISVAFSPDGKTIASGSADNTIRFWNAVSGALNLTLDVHSSSVMSVAYSPDGKTIASGSTDETIKLWNRDNVVAPRFTLAGHGYYVMSVAFSPDSSTIASVSYDEIKLWDVTSGKLKQTLTGSNNNWVTTVAFSPDGKMFASGSYDKTIKLWDTASGTLKQTLAGHSDHVNSVAFSPDGKMIASGSSDNTIKLWDVSSGTLKQTLTGHSSSVVSVAFSPDGKTLASGSVDDTIKLWRVKE